VNATVNGELRELADGETLADLLSILGLDAPGGIAIAVNERIVPRASFASHRLAAGDAVEIVRAVSGG